MRKFFFLLLIALLGFGGWYAWQRGSVLPETAHLSLPNSELHTLEVRYSAEEIMQAHKTELLKNQGYAFLEPKLLFYPYVLMDVKYSKGRGDTGEGALLWGLNDGEMVIHTATWEKTHGFEDCIAAKANKNDYRIIEMIAEQGGAVEREKLYTLLGADQESVDFWVESCRAKKLVAINGNKFRLHFEKPNLTKEPVTTLAQPLVTQPAKNVHKVRGLYSQSEVKRFAQMAFGSEFAIRRCQNVFLPVYAISVQNPDGSILTTHWNALNGSKFETLCR